MIVNRPRDNERINVSSQELKEINEVVAASAGRWTAPSYIADLFGACSNRRKQVFLRSEGWHQKEYWKGAYYQHITVHHAGWTYHMYAKVDSSLEPIKPGTHSIDFISYDAGRGNIVNLSPNA